MASEFELGMELPGRMRIYDSVFSRIKSYDAGIMHTAYGRDKPRLENAHLLEFVLRSERPNEQRFPLVLPSIGNEEAKIDSFSFYSWKRGVKKPFVNGMEFATVNNHDLICMAMKLYNDGSPFLPEEFSLELDLPEYVYVLLGRESLPVMVHSAEFEITQEAWERATKLPLSDMDCEALINLVATQSQPAYIE